MNTSGMNTTAIKASCCVWLRLEIRAALISIRMGELQ